jgi:UDP-2-acetamido-3-amino-2,3-dideoxy-glucuronate N-acetyltransferase
MCFNYNMNNGVYIHKFSEVLTNSIGENSSIWQFCVILAGAKIGKNCNICSHVFIESKVKIGDNVTIKNSNQIWDGMNIGNNVFVGPNVTFLNDAFPRSERGIQKKFKPQGIVIEDGASIGGGATLLPGITVGKGAMIGAGAIVTENVAPFSLYVGPKAKFVKSIAES